jgi:hypothetical protein
MSNEKVQRTNPELWEACKQEAVEKMGKFSARAMQHAVLIYKQRGGGYVGTKSRANALTKWSKEQENLRKIRNDN